MNFPVILSGSNKETPQDDTESFLVEAAFVSTFVPSVVGRQSQKTFLKNGILSLLNKVLLVVVALVLAYTGLSVSFHPRPFLMFCFEENSTYVQENNFTTCSVSRGNCIEIGNDAETLQKIRICEEPHFEIPFQVCALSGLVVTILLAACSTYNLHKRADYQVNSELEGSNWGILDMRRSQMFQKVEYGLPAKI